MQKRNAYCSLKQKKPGIRKMASSRKVDEKQTIPVFVSLAVNLFHSSFYPVIFTNPHDKAFGKKSWKTVCYIT